MQYFINSHTTNIYKIGKACRFSQAMIADVVNTLLIIEQHRGISSVVQILKDRYNALLTGEIDRFKTKEGLWCGCWKNFTLQARRGRRKLRRALRFLKLYGLFIHPEPTLGDYRKQATKLLATPSKRRWLYLPESQLRGSIEVLYERTYSTQYPLTTKRAPVGNGKLLAEILISPAEHINSLADFPNLVLEYYDLFKALVGPSLRDISYYLRLVEHGAKDFAGSVALITKDRGFKLRPIANCNRILQLVLSPLHNALMDAMKTVPESFVYDQDGGARWVTTQLSVGAVLTSLDLKSASDNIPLDPQLQLANRLFPLLQVEIGVFARVARMNWYTPHKGVVFKWCTGHPMGVNVSFGLFTLWLINICYSVGAEGNFCIVGDDLVVNDAYRPVIMGLLQLYGVPINHSKSLFSNDVYAEFVGRILDRYGSLGVFKASKFTKKEPLNVIRQYGRSGLLAGPKRLYKHSYVDVVDSILLYQDSRVLQVVLSLFLPPLDYLKMVSKVPTPVHLGGVSKTIIEKMIAELKPLPLTDKQLAFLERMRNMGEQGYDEETYISSQLEGRLARYRYMNPGDAYEFLIKNEDVAQIAAFTVQSNDAYVVNLHRKLHQALKGISQPEDGYELIIAVEEHLRDEGFIVKDVSNVDHLENLALSGKGVDYERSRKPLSREGSHTFFLFRKIKKAVRNYLNL